MRIVNQLSRCSSIFVLLVATMLPFSAAMATAETVQQDIEALLRTNELAIDGVEILTQNAALEVYEAHAFKPYWSEPDRIRELLSLISNSADHGLLPSDYNIDQLHDVLQQRTSNPSAEIEAEADILLTESLLRYSYHRRYGKAKPDTLDADINFKRARFKHQAPATSIRDMLNASSLNDFIQTVAPTGPIYQQLQSSLQQYREWADNGGWSLVPEGPTLHPGDNDVRVAAIRKRLASTGQSGGQQNLESTRFDKPLEKAVRNFQEHHLLDVDGIVGAQTVAIMNIPIEVRVGQLRASLERLRWVAQEAVPTMVVVNIAGFNAYFFRDGKIEWETPVMVGKNYRQTPVFKGDIAYLEFNPTWTIPPGILRNDTLPAIKKNPNYLASKNIRVIDNKGKIIDPSTVDWHKYKNGVPYTLRQDPGPHNSLGTVKFIFPNSHFVFLHDTPHRELFVHSQRNFSSGCIRVKDPLKLAELILNDPAKYNIPALQSIVDSRETQRISPSLKIPVVIVYLTANINNDGTVVFHKDIYNRDQRVLDALNGPVVLQPPSS